MTIKTRNTILKGITISIIIPIIYLLGVSIFLLIPKFIENIFALQEVLLSLLILVLIGFGILGSIAIFLQLFSNLESRLKLKILFLSLSLIGYFTFISVLTGTQGWMNMLDSLKNIRENLLDFYLIFWPIIVSVILLFFNIKLYLNLRVYNNHSK